MTNQIKMLSIRQPWASLIAHGVKDVENRTWTTRYRGPILIHSGKKVDSDGMSQHPGYVDAPRGAIIGVVDLVDVRTLSESPWWRHGCYAWILQNPKLLPEPIIYTGSLGLVDVSHDDDLQQQLT